MSAAAADARLGVAAYLKAQTAVSTLVEGRVFRPELSTTQDPLMPRACIVVRPAGGGQMFGRDRLQVFDSRVDVVCYGSTRLEAENIGDEVQLALKELSTSKWEGVKLYWARISGGVASAIDPTSDWPFSLVSAVVMHSLRTLA